MIHQWRSWYWNNSWGANVFDIYLCVKNINFPDVFFWYAILKPNDADSKWIELLSICIKEWLICILWLLSICAYSILQSHPYKSSQCWTHMLKYGQCLYKPLLPNRNLIRMEHEVNQRDLIAGTGLVILLKLYQTRRFSSPSDLEIWWMTWKNNRAPFLYYIKLCAPFQIHRRI